MKALCQLFANEKLSVVFAGRVHNLMSDSM